MAARGAEHVPADRAPLIQAGVFIFTLLLVSAPIVVIAFQSLQSAPLYEPTRTWTFDGYFKLVSDTGFREAVLNSLGLATIATIVATAVGVCSAIAIVRFDVPGRAWLEGAMLGPIYISQLVLALVNIFESDFDFTADTRRGDRFRLLVEKRYAGATFVSYGRIMAVQYTSSGRTLTGVGFVAAKTDKIAYYDLAGRSLRKSFLKSPLEFTRITSGFTYARPHPILGGVRPHLAIDYAAPVGTPVRAVADGTVVRAGWNGPNGIQIQLRHRSGYETVYNHLSSVARGLRAGTRVSQRQVIGYVGATGLATGPHLDYRVAKGGAFVNPLGEKFIPGEPISAADKPSFLRESRALVERLETEAPF